MRRVINMLLIAIMPMALFCQGTQVKWVHICSKTGAIEAPNSGKQQTSAAGQLKNGDRPEIVLVVGDGLAPMYMYEYQNNNWIRKMIVHEVNNGHTLAIVDFDGDAPALNIF